MIPTPSASQPSGRGSSSSLWPDALTPERLRALVDAYDLFPWTTDAEGRALDVRAWCDFTGLTDEEARGWGWLDSIHPEDRTRTVEVWQRAIATGSLYAVEYRLRRRDGQYRLQSVRGIPVRDREHAIVGWMGACMDIHDPRLEREARTREQQLATSVLGHMKEAFIFLDRDWRIRYQNPEGARINRKPAPEVVGKLLWEEWPAVLNSPLEWNYRKAVDSREPVQFEHRYWDPGRYDVWLEIQAIPSPEGLGIFYRDITARKSAESALAQSEARFRELAESLRSLFILSDPGFTRLDFVTQASATLLGLEPAALQRDPSAFLRAILPEDRPEVEASLAGGTTEEITLRYRVLGPEGTLRWLGHRRVPVAPGEGGEARVASIITDISDRIELENQLLRSQRMEGVGRLAGGIAHDFNNLLTAIQGHGDFLRMELEGNPSALAELDEIQEAAERAAALTSQILTFARKQVVRPRVVQLQEVLFSMDKLLRRLLGQEVELVTVVQEDAGPVRVDPDQVHQVILNLAVNARDAMPDGGVLRMELSPVEIPEGATGPDRLGVAPGRYTVLSVSDTGTGIEPEIRDQIFDPFFTTKAESRGTGLGLATCYGIVKQAGGHIRLVSEMGEGSTFFCYFPESSRSPEHLDEEAAQGAPVGRGELVLVVEDEPAVRSVAVQSLELLGYRPVEAHDGDHALSLLSNGLDGVALVFSDVVMPGMRGDRLIEEIRDRFPEVRRFLLTSGFPQDSRVLEDGRPGEARGFLPKPYRTRQLGVAVAEILSRPLGSESPSIAPGA